MAITRIDELQKKARWVRQEVLEMCVRAGEGRVASAFSCTEILVALFYGGILRFDPKQPAVGGKRQVYHE